MKKSQHNEAKKIFLSIISSDVESIEEYLLSTTADSEVVALVIDLVKTYRRNTQFTHDFVKDVADNISRSPGLFPSDRYLLIKKIGQGGMGEVFLAQRKIENLNHLVAIKILKHNHQTLKESFSQEMKILSQLSHPNISKFIDADFLSDGRPYVVMEYTEGLLITEYCKLNGLNVSEIIDHFISLCEAVLHAHQNLIIHRDIKPENVLVNTKNELKLLDFGIAKILINIKDSAETKMYAMTPAYASPEQFLGKPISVSSDVYSLGVLLYELLTEKLPYEFKDLSPLEYEKLLKKSKPEIPSVRLSSKHKWVKKIAGDLDTIVMKALKFDPVDRYQSVNELINDLNRYKENRPILAQKPNWFYVANKFVSRNNPLVLIIIGFLVFSVFTFKQKYELNQFSTKLTERAEKIDQQKLLIKYEKTKAKNLVDTLSNSYYADPLNTGKQNLIVGNRINIATGYLYYEHDLQYSPETIGFKIFYNSNYAMQTRNYNRSILKKVIFSNQNFGKGWDHNFARDIDDLYIKNQVISSYRDDGRYVSYTFKDDRWVYEKMSVEKYTVKYSNNPNITTDKYIINNNHGEKEYYNRSGDLEKLETNTNTLLLKHEYLQEFFHLGSKLISIDADDGSFLRFELKDDDLQIIKILDDSGNRWEFKYDNFNNLNQIIYPDGSDKVFSYHGNLLIGIGNTSQSIYLDLNTKYKYDYFNRVYSIKYEQAACGSEKLLIVYHNDLTRTVTNEKGEVNKYWVERVNGVWHVVDKNIEFEYIQDTCEFNF